MGDFMSLADARQAMKGSFIGTVIKQGDLKSGTKNGKDWTSKKFTIEDQSGHIELTAWGDEIALLKVGYKYEFVNPWWKNWEGEAVLALGKYAKVTVVGSATTTEADPQPSSEPESTPPKETSTEPSTDNPKFPLKQKLVHDEIWAFAISEATKVYPLGTAGADPQLTGRLILAQVFYKKNMDYYIHREAK